MKKLKKLALGLLLLLIPIFTFGQNTSVEKIFQKYGGEKGFTTITINQELFKMMSSLDKENSDLKSLSDVKFIKILAVEDVELGKLFNEDIKNQIKKSDYTELMNINEKDSDVVFLVKQKDDIISELLVLAGDKEERALIYIVGKIKLEDIANLTKMVEQKK